MARVMSRAYKQIIEMVSVSRAEVQSWLPGEDKGRRIRGLHCPRCHVFCKQLYLVPWREVLFLCYACAKLPKKKPMDMPNVSQAPSGNTALAALIAEHYRTVRTPQNENETPK